MNTICLIIIFITSLLAPTHGEAKTKKLKKKHPAGQVEDHIPKQPNHRYAIGLSGTYPVMIGVEGVVHLNDKYWLKAIVGPSFTFNLDHSVSPATIIQESLLDESAYFAVHYPSITIPLEIEYSRSLGFDFGYGVGEHTALTLGIVYRRIELSGAGDVPLLASVRADNNVENDLSLQSDIQVWFRCSLDQVDLRLGGSWHTSFLEDFYVQLVGGLWYSFLRVIEPKSSVTMQSEIQQQIRDNPINLSDLIQPHLSEVESGINDDLIEESLRNRIIFPFYAGLSIGYTF